MPPSGDSRPQQDPAHTRPPSHSIFPTLAMCSTAFMSLGGSRKDSPWYDGRYNTARAAAPPTFGPDLLASPLQRLLRRADLSPKPTKPASTLLRRAYQLYEADNPDRANQALGRFADLYATGQTPEYRDIVDTIIVWGEQILAYHTTRRVSDGPLEGINNLHPSPTPRRSRVHQPQQLPSPPNPRNTRTRRVCSAGAGLTHLVTGLWCLCHDLSTWPPPGLLNRGAG